MAIKLAWANQFKESATYVDSRRYRGAVIMLVSTDIRVTKAIAKYVLSNSNSKIQTLCQLIIVMIMIIQKEKRKF